MFKSSNGPGFDEELVHSDQSNNVPAWHILDGLYVTPHHQDGSVRGHNYKKQI